MTAAPADGGNARGLTSEIPGHLDVDEIGTPAVRQRFFSAARKGFGDCHARGASLQRIRKFYKVRVDEIRRHHAAIEKAKLSCSQALHCHGML